MSSLIKDLSMSNVRPKPGDAPIVETKPPSTSMIKEFSNVQTALKSSDKTDAGKSDVSDRATAASDIGFNLMRNTINSSGEVTGSDVANYIERAEELNDEVDTVPFGLETDDGKIVKVYVNAEQADKFEEAMKNMLGLEDDIEEAINRLTTEFDIVDVVWPKSDDEDGDGEPDEDEDLDIDDTSNLEDPEDDADFADDQYDVIAGGDTSDDTTPEVDGGSGKVKATKVDDEDLDADAEDSDKSDDEEEEEESEDDEESDEDDETDPDDPDKPKKKKKKKKKLADEAEPAEPATAAESKQTRGRPLSEKKDPRDDEADSPSTAAAVKLMTSKGLHVAAMKEAPGDVVYIEDAQGDEHVMRGDKKLTKEKHGKKLMSLKKEDITQEKQMTIGNKFLDRVLAEADGQDSDGIKDGFNIPLDSQARAMAAKQKLPFAKRLIAFHFMCGVPGRYMNTSDVSEAVAGAADMLRKKVAVRRAFTTLYEGLAAAKGFNIPKDDQVKEGKIDEAKAKRGSFIQKLLESVLVQLGLPSALIITTGPSAVGTGIYRTAELIEQDSTLERALRMLATRMGIRGSDAQAAVEEGLDEAKKPKLPKDKDAPIEVTGVKGMKSTAWSKKFKNQAALEAWMDKHGEDITVHAYSTDRVVENDGRYSKLAQMAEGRAPRSGPPPASPKKPDIGWFIISKVGSKAVDSPFKTKAKAEAEIEYRADHDQSKPGETAQYGKADSMLFTKMDAVSEAVDVGNDPYAQAVASLVAALGIPDDILQRRRTQILQALRVRKSTLGGRPQIMTLMARLSDLIAKNTTQNGQQAPEDDTTNESKFSRLAQLAEGTDETTLARKVYAAVKGEANLTAASVKKFTKAHASMQDKSAAEVSNIASLVIDMLDEKGLM